MGKQRRNRQKLHLPAPKPKSENSTDQIEIANCNNPTAIEVIEPTPLPLQTISDNIFGGITINLDDLNKKPTPEDDGQTVKSFKSVKSDLEKSKILPKKDKLKLRREMFMKKIDLSIRLRDEAKKSKKRTNVAIMGDVNPLHDALESLLTGKSDGQAVKGKRPEKKPKGIEKSKKMKTNHVQDVSMFKQLMKNKNFKADPLVTMKVHLEAVMQRSRELNKKSK